MTTVSELHRQNTYDSCCLNFYRTLCSICSLFYRTNFRSTHKFIFRNLCWYLQDAEENFVYEFQNWSFLCMIYFLFKLHGSENRRKNCCEPNELTVFSSATLCNFYLLTFRQTNLFTGNHKNTVESCKLFFRLSNFYKITYMYIPK